MEGRIVASLHSMTMNTVLPLALFGFCHFNLDVERDVNYLNIDVSKDLKLSPSSTSVFRSQLGISVKQADFVTAIMLISLSNIY